MKVFSANLDNLRKLYINQLQMLLSTEQQITEALPQMIEKATDTQLKQAFESSIIPASTKCNGGSPPTTLRNRRFLF